MKNRKIRDQYTKGRNGKLILNTNVSVECINENIEAFRIVSRFNQIATLRHIKEMAKTHNAQPMYNNLSTYNGFYWKQK